MGVLGGVHVSSPIVLLVVATIFSKVAAAAPQDVRTNANGRVGVADEPHSAHTRDLGTTSTGSTKGGIVNNNLDRRERELQGNKDSSLVGTPIPNAPTDCSAPTHTVQLADDVSMDYVVTDDSIYVDMTFDAEAWVSFGYSTPENKGKMIGSEAIIGLPLDGKVEKYHMVSEKIQGVYPRVATEQTLTDTSVSQAAGKTYLSFRKLLVEPGEIALVASGTNLFLWAYGYENELGLHDKKTGTAAFSLDVTPCVPMSSSVAVAAVVVTDAPTDRPTKAPTPIPTKRPTAAPVTAAPISASPTRGPTAAPVVAAVQENSGGGGEEYEEDTVSTSGATSTTGPPTEFPWYLRVTSAPTTAAPNSSPPTSRPVTAAPVSPSPTSSPTVAPTTSEPTLAPATAAPVTASPTLNPTPIPRLDGSAVKELERDNSDGNATDPSSTSDLCSTYRHKVQADPKLAMSYVVNTDSAGEHSGSISVKLEYDGTAWLALGVAETPEGKMIGSESVVALPDEPVGVTNPGEYYMVSEANEGVFLMEEDKQTLLDGSIVQEEDEDGNDKTIVSFTRLLSEEGKLGLTASADGVENTFLWAYGYANDLNLHRATGAFRISLTYCDIGDNEVDTDGEGPVETSLQSLSRYTAEETRRMWFAHAILGLLAWAVFCPTAVAASIVRKLFQRWGPLWFKYHMYANMLVLVLTIATFSISVVMYKDESKAHFVGIHEAMGLAILLLVVFQAANGILRPPAPAAAPASNVEKGESSSNHTKDDDMAETAHETAKEPAVEEDPFNDTNKSYIGLLEDGSDTDALEVAFQGASTTSTAAGDRGDPGKSVGEASTKSNDSEKDVPPVKTDQKKVKQLRVAWQTIHKLLGFIMLFMGLWQVNTGLALYSARFGTPNYSYVFWWCIGAFGAVILALTVYLRVKSV